MNEKMKEAMTEALEAPLPTDPEIPKACSFAGVREVLKSRELVSARHLTGWPVMGGAVVTTDGAQHRARRRLESTLFKPDNLRRYELEVLQPSIDAALDHVQETGRDADGIVRADLVTVGRMIMLSIGAEVVGLDVARSDAPRRERLDECLRALIGGVTVEWSHHDHAEVLARAVHWKKIFEEEFVAPAVCRRREVLESNPEHAAAHPDLLSVLLCDDTCNLDYETIVTECVQYLVASTGTTVTAVIHTISHLLAWFEDHPDDASRVADADFLRQAAQESLRLHPGPHLIMRRATTDLALTELQPKQGDLVAADVRQANRDPEVFGEGTDRFDLHRSVPKGTHHEGFTFGGGRHLCAGRPLALGTYGHRDDAEVDGMIVRILRSLFAAGVRTSPDRPATPVKGVEDRFESFPVELAAL